jgi:TetR/AcrR family transcriptional regulator, transcriptional repressor for nem operon
MIATRDEIIGLADQLIRSKGFNAFSYSDISAAMDVRNAAIHYHFPSKSALGISVIDEEMARIATNRQEWAHLPGDEQVKRIMQGFFDKSRKNMICLTGSLTSDYETLSPDMQLKVVEMCEAILSWMGNCLEKGREERTLHFHGKAPDRALLLMSTLASSLLLSRILGPDIFDRMMDQILKDLGTSPAKWEEKSPDWLL